MSWVAAAVVGGSVISGAIGSRSASQQSRAVANSEAAALAEQGRQFDLVRQDTAPQRALGNSAVARLSRLYGYNGQPPQASSEPQYFDVPMGFDGQTMQVANPNYRAPVAAAPTGPDMGAFFESPDYRFNLEQGEQAIGRSLAARGRSLSGAGVKEGARYASGMASREFGSFTDRLMQQAGLGSTGIGASAAAGANAAGNTAQIVGNAGNARASIYGNAGANLNNTAQGTISNLLTHYLSRGPSTSQSTVAQNYIGPGVGRYA